MHPIAIFCSHRTTCGRDVKSMHWSCGRGPAASRLGLPTGPRSRHLRAGQAVSLLESSGSPARSRDFTRHDQQSFEVRVTMLKRAGDSDVLPQKVCILLVLGISQDQLYFPLVALFREPVRGICDANVVLSASTQMTNGLSPRVTLSVVGRTGVRLPNQSPGEAVRSVFETMSGDAVRHAHRDQGARNGRCQIGLHT